MNIHRNVLKIAASALLMASLPAGAQVLGGSLGGAVNGTFGGTLGGAAAGGTASAAGNAGFDASGAFGAFGAARDGAYQAGGKTREIAGSAVTEGRAQVGSARTVGEASIDTAHSVGAKAGRRAARSAAQTRASAEQRGSVGGNAEPRGGLLLSGSGGATAEQHAMGHGIAADGAAGSQTSADRSGLANSSYGQVGVSMKKDEPVSPAAAEAPPAE